jgi:hypothetical protein
MPDDAKDKFKDELTALREDRQSIVRANPRGASTDVQNTFKHMKAQVREITKSLSTQTLIISQWTAVEHRTGGEGFYIFVRKGLDQYYAPQMHYSPGVEQFLRETLDVEPEEFGLRLESFLVGGGEFRSTLPSQRHPLI